MVQIINIHVKVIIFKYIFHFWEVLRNSVMLISLGNASGTPNIRLDLKIILSEKEMMFHLNSCL